MAEIVYPSTYPVIDPTTLTQAELNQMNNNIGWYASRPILYQLGLYLVFVKG